jgi:hypothetical protein
MNIFRKFQVASYQAKIAAQVQAYLKETQKLDRVFPGQGSISTEMFKNVWRTEPTLAPLFDPKNPNSPNIIPAACLVLSCACRKGSPLVLNTEQRQVVGQALRAASKELRPKTKSLKEIDVAILVMARETLLELGNDELFARGASEP